MFEEIPRERRGLAGLNARRVVLGPFAIGGGMVLAMLGGSVAVAAATVLTASTIGLPEMRPSHGSGSPIVTVATSSRSPRSGVSTDAPAAGQGPVSVKTQASPSRSAGPTTPGEQASGPGPTSRPTASTPPPSTGTAGQVGPAPTSPGPVGNAVIYVSGYDTAHAKVRFHYASVQHGSGFGGNDLYSVSSIETYTAGLAARVSIVSAGSICPPAGSSCTVAQFIAAAPHGFFADVAIDARGLLRSVIERDSGTAFGTYSPGPTPSASDSARPSVSSSGISPAAKPAPSPTDSSPATKTATTTSGGRPSPSGTATPTS
ncbi:MAG: hypothetical protein QOH56_1206 [Pseudonocardiales bacterium]|jgi:hypothetical protein|nr:hypothetical protein [Pseudonocardiales bacterium]